MVAYERLKPTKVLASIIAYNVPRPFAMRLIDSDKTRFVCFVWLQLVPRRDSLLFSAREKVSMSKAAKASSAYAG